MDTDGNTSAEAKKKAFQRARKTLHDKGYVECMGDFWWPLFDDPEPNSSPPIRDDIPIPYAEPQVQGDASHDGGASGQDGTHSFRSVPPVPVGEGEHWDRAPEENSALGDRELDDDEDETVEGVV